MLCLPCLHRQRERCSYDWARSTPAKWNASVLVLRPGDCHQEQHRKLPQASFPLCLGPYKSITFTTPDVHVAWPHAMLLPHARPWRDIINAFFSKNHAQQNNSCRPRLLLRIHTVPAVRSVAVHAVREWLVQDKTLSVGWKGKEKKPAAIAVRCSVVSFLYCFGRTSYCRLHNHEFCWVVQYVYILVLYIFFSHWKL